MKKENLFTPRVQDATLITGGPAAGKTATLVQRTQALIDSGVAPQDILFVCAAPTTANNVQQAITNGVAVLTARDVALRVLDSAEPGRTLRVLEPYEEQFLFEDLRTTGLPQKQIRTIYAFIAAQYATLGDWDATWLEMREERLVYDTLQASLAFTDGIIEPEVANKALRILLEQDGLLDTVGFEHVLVDDYGLLNRSSQMLCNILAKTSIAVAGEAGYDLAVYDGHPYPSGLDEFTRLHPGCDARALQKPNDRRGEPNVHYESYPTIKDEFDGIVRTAQEAVGAGIDPSTIALVCTNGRWQRNIAHALQEAHSACCRVPRALRVRSFSDEEGLQAIRQDAAAKYRRNPLDSVAIRSLIGCGDYLARSLELKKLREQYPGETLASVCTHDANASALLEDALTQAPTTAERSCAAEGDGVTVCSPEELFGRKFKVVVFGGYVEGWVPALASFDAVGKRKQALLAQANQEVDCARRACTERLVFTSFEECSLEFAERLGLHYDHVRLKDGVRTCSLKPPVLA